MDRVGRQGGRWGGERWGSCISHQLPPIRERGGVQAQGTLWLLPAGRPALSHLSFPPEHSLPLTWQHRVGQNLPDFSLEAHLFHTCSEQQEMAPTWSGPDVGCLGAKGSGKWGTQRPRRQRWRGLVLQNEAFEPRKGKWMIEVAQNMKHRLGLGLSALCSPGSDSPGLSLNKERGEVIPSKRPLSGDGDVKKGWRPFGGIIISLQAQAPSKATQFPAQMQFSHHYCYQRS